MGQAATQGQSGRKRLGCMGGKHLQLLEHVGAAVARDAHLDSGRDWAEIDERCHVVWRRAGLGQPQPLLLPAG